jgi:hypothetical protein
MLRILPFVLLLAGCADFGAYMTDRGNDFLDCFKLQAGIGLLADAEVRVTDYVSFGAGIAAGTRWGIDGRDLVGFNEYSQLDIHVGLPFTPWIFWILPESMPGERREGTIQNYLTDYNIRVGGMGWSRRTDKSILFFDMTAFERFRENEEIEIREGNLKPFFVKKERKLIDALDVEVGATCGLSARAGFSPGQFADFLLGWFGLDIAGDDTAGKDLFEKYGLKGIYGEIVFQNGSYTKSDDGVYNCKMEQYYRQPWYSYIILMCAPTVGHSWRNLEFTLKEENGRFALKSLEYEAGFHSGLHKYSRESGECECAVVNGTLKGVLSGKMKSKVEENEPPSEPIDFKIEFRLSPECK